MFKLYMQTRQKPYITREIVSLLEKINSHDQTNILFVERIEEQQNNLNDLSTIINDMDKLLKKE
ncbi:Uncharacterised protein [Bacillus tequilensis]|nr:Uncharacterised protein [Bacillus tequilensis]